MGGAQVRLLEKSGLVRDLDVRELAAEELLALAFKVRLVAFELAKPGSAASLVHAQPRLCSAMRSSVRPSLWWCPLISCPRVEPMDSAGRCVVCVAIDRGRRVGCVTRCRGT